MNLRWPGRGSRRQSDPMTVAGEDGAGPARESSATGGEAVVGERGISSINRARSLQSRITNLLAMSLMTALGVGLLGWYYAHTFSVQSRARQNAQAVSRDKAQGEMALPSLGSIEPPPVGARPSALAATIGPPPALPVTNALEVSSIAPAAAPYPGGPAPKTPAELALERKLSGPAFDRQMTSTPTTTAPEAAAPDGQTRSAPPGGSIAAAEKSNGIQDWLTPTITPAVRATVLPTQRLLLPKGAFIDCTLETAIDSTLPGMTTCITATDTFGADGSTVLLERGTKLVGETRGQVQQGSARVFVLWTEARTPTGVVIPLASPGTDELGRAGLSGLVNRHFLERFGAAILISVIDGAVQSAVQSRNSGGTVIYDPAASQQVMTEVLKDTVNIAPTVTKANGDRIQILVARDLDFRSVYELRPTNTTR